MAENGGPIPIFFLLHTLPVDFDLSAWFHDLIQQQDGMFGGGGGGGHSFSSLQMALTRYRGMRLMLSLLHCSDLTRVGGRGHVEFYISRISNWTLTFSLWVGRGAWTLWLIFMFDLFVCSPMTVHNYRFRCFTIYLSVCVFVWIRMCDGPLGGARATWKRLIRENSNSLVHWKNTRTWGVFVMCVVKM